MRRSVFYFGGSARPTNVHTDHDLDDLCFVKNEIGAPHTAICILVPFSWKPTRQNEKKAEFEEHEGGDLDLFVTKSESFYHARVIARQIVSPMVPRTLSVALVSEDTDVVLPATGRVPAVPLAWVVEVCATPHTFVEAIVLLGDRARQLIAYTGPKQKWACAVVPIWAVPACMLRWGHRRELVDAWRAQIERQLMSRRSAYPDGLEEMRKLK